MREASSQWSCWTRAEGERNAISRGVHSSRVHDAGRKRPGGELTSLGAPSFLAALVAVLYHPQPCRYLVGNAAPQPKLASGFTTTRSTYSSSSRTP